MKAARRSRRTYKTRQPHGSGQPKYQVVKKHGSGQTSLLGFFDTGRIATFVKDLNKELVPPGSSDWFQVRRRHGIRGLFGRK